MTGEVLMVRIINALIGIVALILGLFILLQLLGAGETAPVVSWLYGMGQSLSAPFRGIFGNILLSGRSVIDVSAIIAGLVYSLVGTLVISLVRSLFHVSHTVNHPHATHIEE